VEFLTCDRVYAKDESAAAHRQANVSEEEATNPLFGILIELMEPIEKVNTTIFIDS